jgi:soluble lytic murein transglycosylase-like protein
LTKRRLLLLIPAIALGALAIAVIVLVRRPLQRRIFRQAPAYAQPAPPVTATREGPPPIEQWTAELIRLEDAGQWDAVDELLDVIEQKWPALYAANSLAWLHARALIETAEPKEALAKLQPFLAPGHPLRDLALFHQAEIAVADNEPAEASRVRRQLIAGYPQSPRRAEAIEDELASLATGTPQETVKFANQLYPAAPPKLRRDLDATIVESLVRMNDFAGAAQRGMAVLKGSTADDPADRVVRALDRSEIISRLSPEQRATMGESLQSHRHFARAVALLQSALPQLPKRRDELQFAIGRSYFGDERYAEAERTYRDGAATADPKAKATFLFHASRAAQLQGADARAEQFMTGAIAVPGLFPATTAALTQRLRTRLKQKRVAEALADLQQLRRIAPKDHSVVEASLAFGIWQVANGKPREALVTLDTIPRPLMDKYDPSEVSYWRARALESIDPHQAFAAYLTVLRAPVPTHFAYFARERLKQPPLSRQVAGELLQRDAQTANLVAAKNYEAARQTATDRLLLTPSADPKAVERLAAIYRELPRYRAVLELKPLPFPAFPLPANADRLSLLLAMGLFDEATDLVPRKYPLQPPTSGLTQSLALNRGSASRESILAIEVLMNGMPQDYVPELLPLVVRELLYPRYFHAFILEDSKEYGADPTLVLSIMREESRFNPRAKSEAAARGLLQFIITTARQIGRDVGLVDLDPSDLYDPRVIIRLGAKYISELTTTFGGDRYKAAAAYNAGPHQVTLWSRLAPAAGDDYFLSSINFDETKHYVRKVMNSHRRYDEIYENAGPQGGVRAEP